MHDSYHKESCHNSNLEVPAEPSDARDDGLDPGLDPACLLPTVRSSPLARLTNTTGGCVEAISNLNSAVLLFVRDSGAFLLVLGWGEGRGSPGPPLYEDVVVSLAAAEDEEPSLANTTGISSRDSAESELYSAGGAAAWTGPEAGTRGGREALRGNAGKGSLWARDTADTLLGSAGGQRIHNSRLN